MMLASVLLAAAAVFCLVRPAGAPGHPKNRPPVAATGRRAPRPALLQLVAVAGVVVTSVLVAPGPFGWCVALLAGAFTWRRSARWETTTERRRRARLDAELPHVVDLLVAALTAGAAPADALGRVAGVVDRSAAEELGVWVARLRLGTDPVTVWTAMGRHPQLGRLGTALRRSSESGAPVAASLGRLAEDLRARRRADVEGRVRQVEVKAAVPLGVCLLPAFVLVGVVPLVAGSVIGLLGVR